MFDSFIFFLVGEKALVDDLPAFKSSTGSFIIIIGIRWNYTLRNFIFIRKLSWAPKMQRNSNYSTRERQLLNKTLIIKLIVRNLSCKQLKNRRVDWVHLSLEILNVIVEHLLSPNLIINLDIVYLYSFGQSVTLNMFQNWNF